METSRYIALHSQDENSSKAESPFNLSEEEKQEFRLLVKRLDQIDELRSGFPFGKELSKEVAGRLYKQYLCLTLETSLKSQNTKILPQCQEVYHRFKIWGNWYHENKLSWLEKYEEIEDGMLDLLFIARPPRSERKLKHEYDFPPQIIVPAMRNPMMRVENDEKWKTPPPEYTVSQPRDKELPPPPRKHRDPPPVVYLAPSPSPRAQSASPPEYDFIWSRIVWRREVLHWIRRVFPLTVQKKLTSSQSNAHPEQEQKDLEEERQRMDVCSRVLAELAGDPENSATFRKRCQQHLMELCLRRYYVPQNLRRSGIIRSHKESLGNGGSADIYHGFFGSHEVAIKSFRIRQDTAAHVQKAFAKEAMILSTLKHEHIVNFRGVLMEGSELCIIVDWMPHGDITDYVRNTPNADKEYLINQVASGLEYLHAKGVVHGDLKGENVLVDRRGRAKLSDFGLSSVEKADYQNLLESDSSWFKDLELSGLPESTITTVTTLLTTVGGTPRWMSPERLVPSEFGRTSAKPCTASDVWAFGLLCDEIYTGLKPYHQFSGFLPIMKIIEGVIPEERDEVPVPMLTAMAECWKRDPKDRPPMGWMRWRVELYRWNLTQAERLRQFGSNNILGHEWGALARWLEETFDVYPVLQDVVDGVYDVVKSYDEETRRIRHERDSNTGTYREYPDRLLVPSDHILDKLREAADVLEGLASDRGAVRQLLFLAQDEAESGIMGWTAEEISQLTHRRGIEDLDIFSPIYDQGSCSLKPIHE